MYDNILLMCCFIHITNYYELAEKMAHMSKEVIRPPEW